MPLPTGTGPVYAHADLKEALAGTLSRLREQPQDGSNEVGRLVFEVTP